MEALGIRTGPVAWKRPPPKPENFIARNKTLIKDISRKQGLIKASAKPVPQRRKPTRPYAAAQQLRPQEVSPPREAEDSVLVSKRYLEELLSFKVHNSAVLPARADPNPSTVAVPSSNSRVEVDSTRENARAAGGPTYCRGKAPSSSVVVEYDVSEVPGLGRHEVGAVRRCVRVCMCMRLHVRVCVCVCACLPACLQCVSHPSASIGCVQFIGLESG